MLRQVGIALALVAVASTARGQSHAEVDSLIDAFLANGLSASWTPSRLFLGCPKRMEPWQEYGFRRLASMGLTPREEEYLASAWVAPIHHCNDPQLDQWFMDHFDAAIQRGEWQRKHTLRMGLKVADRPRIQTYLWNLATNESQPQAARGWALGLYFERLSTDEKLSVFLEAFETPQRFPLNAGVAMAQALLERSPQALMQKVGDLVRADAALANQYAFDEIVQASYRYTDLEARRALADALEDGLANTPGLASKQRTRLEGSVRHLRGQDW